MASSLTYIRRALLGFITIAASLTTRAAQVPTPLEDPKLLVLSASEESDEKQEEPIKPVTTYCMEVAERDKEALQWSETWEAWHHFTITAYHTPILTLLASYLKPRLAVNDLRLNEWMRYWYVCRHMLPAWQPRLAEPMIWERITEGPPTPELLATDPVLFLLSQERAEQLSPSKKQEGIAQLWACIEKSKQPDYYRQRRVVQAASHSLTILHRAKISLREKDLANIHVAVEVEKDEWKGPHLSGAVLSDTNFRGADLRGTNFQGSCLYRACLEGAQLAQADFGLLGEPKAANPRRHTDRVHSVSFSPDGKLLASGSEDGTICLWDTRTGKWVRRILAHTQGVRSVCFSPDGSLASGSEDKTISIWDAKKGLRLGGAHYSPAVWNINLSFSPDGSMLAAGGQSSLRVWDTTTGQRAHGLTWPPSVWNWCAAFCQDGRILACTSSHFSPILEIWDVRTVGRICTLEGHTGGVQNVSFSPNGLWLASAANDQTVRIWDTTTGQSLCILDQPKARWVVSLSPDCSMLAASAGCEVEVWQLYAEREGEQRLTGKYLHYLRGHNNEVLDICFSPDCTTLASASWDHTVRIWDLSTGELLHTLGTPSVNVAHLQLKGAQGLSPAAVTELVRGGAEDPRTPASGPG